MAVALRNDTELDGYMEIKRLTVSSKRQITIPKKFYDELGLSKEIECFVDNGVLVIKPLSERSSGEFAAYILRDLIKQGLQGNELLRTFIEEQGCIRDAALCLLQEANNFAAKSDDKDIANANSLFDIKGD